MRRTYATSFPHDSRRRRKLPGTIFLTVNFLNRREIPPSSLVAQRKTIHTARRPYDVLTAVTQRTHCQTSLRHTDRSRTTKTNLRHSYATLAS